MNERTKRKDKKRGVYMSIINYVVVGSNRIKLPKNWHEIANELELSEYEKTLLSMHFGGSNTLASELEYYSKDLTTDWFNLSNDPRASKVRLYHGRVQYKTHKGDYIRPHIKQRSNNDNHRNMYLSYGHIYLHRLKAWLVYHTVGANIDLKGLVVHHRLTDETSTIQGNSLDNLVVLTEWEHATLHKALDKITDYAQFRNIQLQLPLSV